MSGHHGFEVRSHARAGRLVGGLATVLGAFLAASAVAVGVAAVPPTDPPVDMTWIPGGSFIMGGVGPEARPDEFPRHLVRVDGFFIGTREVTNADFKRFVDATGYRTVAERAVDWEELKKQVAPGTPKPPDRLLQPGSLVFTELSHGVPAARLPSR